MIINYSIQIEILNDGNKKNKHNNSISLGIKSKNDSKINIIKGSKCLFNFSNINDNNKIQINNTVLYMGNGDEELCMIGEFYFNYNIIFQKSIIKILFI
jgi:hypothetical protein